MTLRSSSDPPALADTGTSQAPTGQEDASVIERWDRVSHKQGRVARKGVQTPQNATKAPTANPEKKVIEVPWIPEIVKSQGVDYMVVKDVEGNVIGGHRESVPISGPASTIKLFLAEVVLDAIQRGEISLDETLPATDGNIKADFDGKLGEVMTVREALRAMLADSDNTPFNALIRRLGGPVVINQRLRSFGYQASRINRYLSRQIDSVSVTNVANATEAAESMRRLYFGVTPYHREIQQMLRDAEYQFDVAERVANKYGMTKRLMADVAVLNVDGQTFVVAVYFNSNDEPEELRQQWIRHAERAIIDRLRFLT